MNQCCNLSSLPDSILIRISEYLSLYEITLQLGLTCTAVARLVPRIKRNLLKSFMPLELRGRLEEVDMDSILRSRKHCHKLIELPFWGVRTNGGKEVWV